jgi:hypothetical protein
MRAAFYTETDDRKASIIVQGLQATRQGILGLA